MTREEELIMRRREIEEEREYLLAEWREAGRELLGIENGDLTRCCGAAILRVPDGTHPENGDKEICAECGR